MVYYNTKIHYQKTTVIHVKDANNIYDSYVYHERPNTLFKSMFNDYGNWIERNPIVISKNKESKINNIKTNPFLLFK